METTVSDSKVESVPEWVLFQATTFWGHEVTIFAFQKISVRQDRGVQNTKYVRSHTHVGLTDTFAFYLVYMYADTLFQ